MYWSYLQKKYLDPRFMLVAGYLCKRISGKHLVDVNCGTARILRYLPNDFSSYLGNDINSQFLTKKLFPNVTFLNIDDESLVKKLKGSPIDILMSFGISAAHLLPHRKDSVTLNKSIKSLIRRHHPEIVILESCREHEKNLKILSNLVNYALELGYKEILRVTLEAKKEKYHTRIVAILEK